jgi:hypothetical protein
LAIQLAMAIALAALLALSAHALLRGPWLDEFWTLELSDPSRGLLRLSDGWLRDTHPPAFNVWATLLSSLGITSIPLARLASNLPAAGLMFWAAAEAVRRHRGDRSCHATLLLVVLVLPQSVEDFANYRSYFWQIAGHCVPGGHRPSRCDDEGRNDGKSGDRCRHETQPGPAPVSALQRADARCSFGTSIHRTMRRTICARRSRRRA